MLGGVSMPFTHQAPFGTMGTIHASDSLKHERGVRRLKGRLGPWRDLWFLRGLAIPEGGTDRGTSVRPPVHPRPTQTQLAQIRRAWVCGLVGLWGFVLFFLRTFLCVFWLCSEPLVPCTIGPCKDA